MMNHTAIIIVTFNPSSEDLQHIRDLSASCEGYIVDNSPSPILQQKEIGKMNYIWMKGNKGIGEAQEYALIQVLAQEVYTYVVFLDQDSRIDAEYVRMMVSEYERVLQEKPNLGILGPTILNATQQEEYHSCIRKKQYQGDGFLKKENIISSGSCISCKVLEKIGFPDSRLFLDYVDSEWCWRAHKRGFICGQTDRCQLSHQIGIKTIHLGVMQDILSAPMRYYYQYRNFLWLLHVKYVPRYWKLTNAAKLLLRPFYLPFVTSHITPYYIYMLRGVWDGITQYKKYKNHK